MKKITCLITKAISPPIAVLLLALFAGNVMAQSTVVSHPKFADILKPGSTDRWLDFREGTTINPNTFFTEFAIALGLSGNDEMRLDKIKNDEIGFQHFNYNQYYKNQRVVFGEFKLHQRSDGFVQSANGRLITGINSTSTPSLTEQLALQKAMQYVNAKKYLWENEIHETELKRIENNPNATYYPVGELVFAPSTFDAKYLAKDYRLAWSFKIYTDDINVEAKNVFVDAATGQVNYYTPLSMICSAGTGTSAFNGSVSLSTFYVAANNNYRSHNDCQATDLRVYNCAGGGAQTVYYTDADNTWTAQSATQCQWGVAQTYSYYFGQHSRQSWDGSAGDMIAYNNANAGENNACWGCTGNQGIFYAGNTSAATDDWNTNDIIGHEFTHGVTQDESGLIYEKESGALNESFSDIFGEMVESWSEGNCDYLVGADRGYIRSFINPNVKGDPDTYNGTNYVATVGCTPVGGSGGNDYCGVHTNSGVQNHWFYLLSEGGSGTNDNGLAYSVTGITRFSARDIAYRGLVFYLGSSDQFIDARAASLHAAYDLFGGCSTEIIQTGNAWRAVGVESQSGQYNNTVTCGNYPALGTYSQAIHQLTVANSCAVNITASATTVYFSARDRVVIYPGFNATSGSNFYAYIEPCAITLYKGAAPQVTMSDAEKGFIEHPELGPNSEFAKGNDISVVPNPVKDVVTLSFVLQSESNVKIELFDVVGNLIVKWDEYQSLSEGIHTMNYQTSELKSGVYFVSVSINGQNHNKKIIKVD